MDVPSTLTPAQTAQAMVRYGIAKHNERYEIVFFKAVSKFSFKITLCFFRVEQVSAGVMLSFGGLLSEILSGGAMGLTQSNPGIVKVLGGFVFPVGLVM
jgi:formate/nitrite transporter FocA (FNT family)